MKTNIKIIATSLALASSMGAWAGIGGLNVQSHLGQPFSGSIVVTGDEAEALRASRRVSVSGNGIRGSVVPQGNGSVVVRLRSSSPIREPIITFTVSAGRQTREYTAMLDPARYTPQATPKRAPEAVEEEAPQKPRKPKPTKTQAEKAPATTKAGEIDFIERNGQVPAHSRNDVGESSVERKPAKEKAPAEPREIRKPTRSEQAPQTTAPVAERPAVRKSGKAAVAPRRHRAQAGETLSSIAERYRPRNMSLQSAMRGLVMANPSAFKRGNTIQRNTTLYIPNASQWHAYAERAQYQASARPAPTRPAAAPQPRQQATVGTVAPPQPDAAVTPPPASPSKPQPPKETEAAKPAPQKQPQPPAAESKTASPPPQAAESKAASKPATPPTPPKPAEKPTEAAPPKAASPVQPNQSAEPSATSQVAAPSTPAAPVKTASPAVASSSVAAASAASAVSAVPAPAEQTPPPPPPPTPTDEVDAEEEFDIMEYVPYGAGALGILGASAIGYWVLRRRKEQEDSLDDDDDLDDDGVEWIEEENFSNSGGASNSLADRIKSTVAPAAAAAVASTAASASDELDSFEDLPDADLDDDDDVIFEPAPLADNEPKFSLDAFDPEPMSLDNANLVAMGKADADENDDWAWENDSSESALPDLDTKEFDHLEAAGKVDDSDWSLDDGIEEPIHREFSLDGLDDEAQDFASQSTQPQAAVDDIDAMFANALANLDNLAPTEKAKPAAAELDDIDAMFAGALANLDAHAKGIATAADDDDDDDDGFDGLDELDNLSQLDELDELAAAEAAMSSKAKASAVDDIDALFAGALANLDSLAHDEPEPTHLDAPAKAPAPDDIDALFANALAGLDGLQENKAQADMESDSPTKLSDFDKMAEYEAVIPAPIPEPVDDIDSMFADALGDLESLAQDAPSIPSADDLSNDEIDSLNSLSDFDDAALFASTSPTASTASAPVNEVDAMFADALAGLDALSHAEKAANAPEDINHNALSTLDNLSDPITDDADSMFAAALAGLDDLNGADFGEEEAVEDLSDDEIDSLNSLSDFGDLDGLAFEAPQIPEAVIEEPEPTLDADALAFDLSGFDALQDATATQTEPEAPAAFDDDDGLAFDLSSFDALSNEAAEAETPAEDFNLGDDGLAFEAPELPEIDTDSALSSALDMPALPDDFGDFSLPETNEADELDDLPALSLDDADEFDMPADMTSSGSDAGFVSGSVGSEEPLKARLELAKMFIEIGDSDTALETLNELVNEASGDIKAQAEQLLAELA